MKCLWRGQKGKEHPTWHFETASLAATAFGSVAPPPPHPPPALKQHRWHCPNETNLLGNNKDAQPQGLGHGQEMASILSYCSLYKGGRPSTSHLSQLGTIRQSPPLHCYYTAKEKCRKLEANIPRKGISGSQSQFPHSCVRERIIYSIMGLPFLLEEICGPILAIYKSLTDT
jgi:hypothetical protein